MELKLSLKMCKTSRSKTPAAVALDLSGRDNKKNPLSDLPEETSSLTASRKSLCLQSSPVLNFFLKLANPPETVGAPPSGTLPPSWISVALSLPTYTSQLAKNENFLPFQSKRTRGLFARYLWRLPTWTKNVSQAQQWGKK